MNLSKQLAYSPETMVFWMEEWYQFLSEVVNSQKLWCVLGVVPLMGVSMETFALGGHC